MINLLDVFQNKLFTLAIQWTVTAKGSSGQGYSGPKCILLQPVINIGTNECWGGNSQGGICCVAWSTFSPWQTFARRFEKKYLVKHVFYSNTNYNNFYYFGKIHFYVKLSWYNQNLYYQILYILQYQSLAYRLTISIWY